MLQRLSAEDIEMNIWWWERDFKNSTIFSQNGKFLFKDHNLINVDFSNSELQWTGFQNTDLTEANFSNSIIILWGLNADEIFLNSILKDADFRNVQVFWYSKENKYKISLADILSKEQYDNVIKTDEEEYQSKLRLQKENQEQQTQLESTSNQQIKSLVEWFKNLEKEYYFEERMWLGILSIIVFVLIFLVSLPLWLKAYPHPYIIILPIIVFLWIFLLFIDWIKEKKIENKDFNSLQVIKWSLKNIKTTIMNLWNSLEWNIFVKIWKSLIKFCIIILYIPIFILWKCLDFILGTLYYLYQKRYRIWLYGLIILILTPFVYRIIEQELWKKFIEKSDIVILPNENAYFIIIPIVILFLTLLYFSVVQYSKSKKLRIDNQNKIALIHGMMAIKADTTNMDKEKFYDKIADIVFDRVHHEKEENLPLDKIIQLIKAINPKDSQK